jgi:hypothetical protein
LQVGNKGRSARRGGAVFGWVHDQVRGWDEVGWSGIIDRSRRPNPYSRAGLDCRLSLFNITSIAYCVCTFSQKDLKSALSRRYQGTSVHAKVYWYNGGISDFVCRYRYDTGEILTKCSKGNLSISLDSRVASGDISGQRDRRESDSDKGTCTIATREEKL